MATITKPIMLDETGQRMATALEAIENAFINRQNFELIESLTLTEPIVLIERNNLNLKSIYYELTKGSETSSLRINGSARFYQSSYAHIRGYWININGVFIGNQWMSSDNDNTQTAPNGIYRQGLAKFSSEVIDHLELTALNGASFGVGTNFKIYGIKA